MPSRTGVATSCIRRASSSPLRLRPGSFDVSAVTWLRPSRRRRTSAEQVHLRRERRESRRGRHARRERRASSGAGSLDLFRSDEPWYARTTGAGHGRQRRHRRGVEHDPLRQVLPLQASARRRGSRRTANEMLSRRPFREGQRVLDVGCGFGDSTLKHRGGASGRDGDAVGVDCAENFVRRATAEARAAEIAECDVLRRRTCRRTTCAGRTTTHSRASAPCSS